eukprot:scaffold24853_cov63-Phaeocystis_antarctica.AAC.4
MRSARARCERLNPSCSSAILRIWLRWLHATQRDAAARIAPSSWVRMASMTASMGSAAAAAAMAVAAAGKRADSRASSSEHAPSERSSQPKLAGRISRGSVHHASGPARSTRGTAFSRPL